MKLIAEDICGRWLL